MNIPAPTLDIAGFAASVRAELSDLPADDVDDLVDGLDADLAEQAAESDDFTLPDPVAYAAELRTAAGLPERSTDAAPRVPITQRARAWAGRVASGIRSNRAGAATLDFLVALRPVWWMLRGYAFYGIVLVFTTRTDHLLPSTPGDVLLLAVVAVLSVQWGRGRWLPWRWMRVGLWVIGVVCVFLLPVFAGSVSGQIDVLKYNASSAESSYPEPGLTVDGQRVRNIFAYDSSGQPLTDVQLFDQDGKPLNTVGSDTSQGWDPYFARGEGPAPVPLTIPGRGNVWNVYPLQEVPANADPENGGALPAVAPFPQVPSVAASETPAASPSPQSSALPSPEASR